MSSSWRKHEKVSLTDDESSNEDQEEAIFTSDESEGETIYTKSQDVKTVTKINDSTLISSDEEEGAVGGTDVSPEQPKRKTYKGFIPLSEKLLQETKVETFEISSDDETNDNKKRSSRKTPSEKIHPLNLTKERQTELINAKKFYEQELLKEKARLESLKATTKVVELNNLPDKGAKLRSSIEKQVQKVKELNEQLNHVASNIEDKSSSESSKVKVTKSDLKIPSIEDLTRDNTDLSEMGKTALATHQAHQSQTVQTLERLHKFLRKSTEEKEADDPAGLKVPLLPHQKVGLRWLLLREKEIPAGGILADDMGLGKTLTTIALILKDKDLSSDEKKGIEADDDSDVMGDRKFPQGHTLVVCPASVMGQWSSEINSKVKGGRLSVCLHHGTKKETKPHRLASYDVVLTTYTILLYENKGERSGPLLNIRWKRIVLDEAHTVRNYKSQTAQAVFALRAKRRWALTGTPVHNRLDDYFSLLKFLKCKPFDDIAIWKKMVGNRSDAGMKRLQLITKSLLLRRTKDEIQQSGGLQSLKPKKFMTIDVKLDPEEMKVYTKIAHFSQALLAQYIEQKAEKENLLEQGLDIRRKGLSNPFAHHPELSRLYNNMLHLKGNIKTHQILVLLLRLRQACCHPSLVTSLIDKEEIGVEVEDDAGNDLNLLDQMMNLSIAPENGDEDSSKKLLSSADDVFKSNRCSSKMRAAIECLHGILESGGEKAIIVSQWTSVLDILNNFLKEMGIKSVSLDGRVPVKDRICIIDDFNNNTHGPRILLLSLAAGGTGLNLIGANHLLMIDVHWNPQLEAQACDRIYRVGQTKEVHIYKFLCKDTIEERILKLQKEKLELAEGVLSGSARLQSSKLTLHDLKQLFDIK